MSSNLNINQSVVDQDAILKQSAIPPIDVYRVWRTANIVNRLQGSSLADIGCGNGDFIVKAARNPKYTNITGADLSKVRLKTSKKNLKTNAKIEFIEAPIENLPFKNQQFDIVTSFEVLEHTLDVKVALRELQRVSKKYVVISVPYKEKLVWDACVHCGKTTPHYGHLHSLDLEYFQKIAGNEFTIVSSNKIGSKFIIPFFLILRNYFPIPIAYILDRLFLPIFGTPRWILLVLKRNTNE